MKSMVRTTSGRYAWCAAGAIAAALVLGQPGVAAAATTFQVPSTVMSQSWGTPRTFTVFVAATVGDQPGTTTFSVANPGEFGGSNSLESRARVQWLNLATGVSGVVEVPDRFTAQQPCDCAPAAVTVPTGSGQIAAVVTGGGKFPPATITPGFGTFSAP